jgi:DNA helicase IV
MIYLPLAWDLLTKDYQLVVVDEAQDMTKAQLEIVQRVCDGRLCFVGDDRQAIYAFRGADTGSLDRLKTELNALELPLTTTYRCGQSIVERARLLVPDFEAGPANPVGIVEDVEDGDLLQLVKPGDFVLSRLNAPLVSLTLRLLRNGVRARMAGRDIGAGILSILKRCKVESWTPVTDALNAIDAWERKMTTRYASFGELQLVDQTRDQADMLRALMEDADTMRQVMANCDHLFTDDPDATHVVCSSIHKAKGLEAQKVYLLWDSLYRRGVNQEEQNLEYVATTRAISYLGIVRGTPSLQRRVQ